MWLVGLQLLTLRLSFSHPEPTCTSSQRRLVQWQSIMSLHAQDSLLFRTKPEALPVALSWDLRGSHWASQSRPELTEGESPEQRVVIRADCCPGFELGIFTFGNAKQNAWWGCPGNSAAHLRDPKAALGPTPLTLLPHLTQGLTKLGHTTLLSYRSPLGPQSTWTRGPTALSVLLKNIGNVNALQCNSQLFPLEPHSLLLGVAVIAVSSHFSISCD